MSRSNGYAGTGRRTPTPPCWSTRRGFSSQPFLDYDGASYDSYLELDRAVFFLTQTVARGMAQRQGGSSSTSARCGPTRPSPTPSSAYSVAKGGTRLHPELAIELAQYGIRVNAVAPAFVATPIYERFVPKDKLEETLHSFDGFHPLGRVGTAATWPTPSRFLPGHQLGHRRHLGRRRRRHGRTQLTTTEG